VVCKATRAYLEVREAAFRHVETLLSALIVEKPVAEQGDGSVDPSVGGACAQVRFGSQNKKEEPEPAVPAGSSVNKVASVKVAVLDAEHERCEAALVRLAEQRSAAALREVLAAYEEHFAHEEALLDQHLYAGVDDAAGFSADKGARTSHFADHERMLAGIREILSCANANAVPASEVQRLQSQFEKHATSYDGGYADRLSAAIAAQ
jgi:hemerythrin